jgi:hypothetical protein
MPPPLPGASRSRAIVHVARATQAPAASATPRVRRRWAELALTGAALAAAGAIGVFAAVHTMERALADALAPRSVVADLSPALPAPIAVPIAASTSTNLKPIAPPVPTTPVAATPVVATTLMMPVVHPSVPARAPVNSTPTPKRPAAERAVVADAKPVASKPPSAAGLFDDAN